MPAFPPFTVSSLRTALSAGRAWEWAQAGLLVLNLVWTTLALGGFRPETRLISLLLTTLLLGTHLADRAWGPARGRPWHPAGWWLLPFLVYAAINARWVTPVPWLGEQDLWGWAQLVAVFWVALNGLPTRAVRQAVAGVIAGLAVVAVLLAAYQRFVQPHGLPLGRVQVEAFWGRGSGPFGIPNSLAAFLLLILPATLGELWKPGGTAVGRVVAGWLALVFLAGLGLTLSRSAWLCLALALTAWPWLAVGSWRRRRAGLSAAVLAGLLVAGVGLYGFFPEVRARWVAVIDDAGEKTRPVMWHGAWQLFLEAPLWGTGAGSYNASFERYRPENYRDEPQWAHNEYLNTLSDYGLVGFGLWFGAIGAIALGSYRARARRADAGSPGRVVSTRALAVGLAAFGLSLGFDFHLKIPALGLLASLIGAEWVRQTWRLPAAPMPAPGTRWRLAGVAMGAAVAFGGGAWPAFHAEAERYRVRGELDGRIRRDALSAEFLEAAGAVLERAGRRHPANGQIWADRAYVASLAARYTPARTGELGREAEAAAWQALARSVEVAEFWLRLGVALDLQGRWLEAGASFVEALRLAPASAAAWYHQAYHLSLRPATRPLARAAIATSLRLEPGHAAATALRKQLAAHTEP